MGVPQEGTGEPQRCEGREAQRRKDWRPGLRSRGRRREALPRPEPPDPHAVGGLVPPWPLVTELPSTRGTPRKAEQRLPLPPAPASTPPHHLHSFEDRRGPWDLKPEPLHAERAHSGPDGGVAPVHLSPRETPRDGAEASGPSVSAGVGTRRPRQPRYHVFWCLGQGRPWRAPPLPHSVPSAGAPLSRAGVGRQAGQGGGQLGGEARAQ